ncbi:hypothetical protein EXD76_05435 [BEV proteobacterium]|nr:hypothetical protein [Candidatus Symbiopectobacterium sp. Chty_BC]
MALPDVVRQTGQQISGLALPLVLLCAGASLDFKTMLRTSNVATLSTVAELVVSGLLTLGGWLIGFRGGQLGGGDLSLCLDPTPAGSYATTRAMGGTLRWRPTLST